MYITKCYRVYQREWKENASFLSIFNGSGGPKWCSLNFPQVWKNLRALGSLNFIFKNNSLNWVPLLEGKIWGNWKLSNWRRIFDIYRNWLLIICISSFCWQTHMRFFYLCIQFCSQVTRLSQTRVCGAGVMRKSMGTFSCAKDPIVKFNGFRMFFFLCMRLLYSSVFSWYWSDWNGGC